MSKSIKLTALLLFLFAFFPLYSQDKILDSLNLVLRNPKLHDTTRLQIMSDVMYDNYTEFDKDYYQINEMIGKLALKNYKDKNTSPTNIVYAEWLAAYYTCLANLHTQKKTPQKAFASYDKAIAILKAVKSYDEMYVSVLGKAAFYSSMAQDGKAIPLVFSALKYYEKDPKKYTEQLPYALQLLSHIYLNQRQFKKSIQYGNKAIKAFDVFYAESPNNHTLYLKAQSISDIGHCYSRVKRYREAISVYRKSIGITQQIGAESMTAITLAKLAECELMLSNDKKAIQIYEQILGMKSLSTATDPTALANATIQLGGLYLKIGELDKAKMYAVKGLELSEDTGEIALKDQAARLMYAVSFKNRDFEKALEMYKYSEKIIDSSQVQASKNEMAQQNLKYNFEKKELRMKLDSEKRAAVKNNWLIGLSGIILLLLLGVYFYYRNNKQKQEIAGLEKSQIKQKLLITQMNPHFIFNSIGNIQQLIHDEKDEDAINYLNKFSVLTRQILENSNENYISLQEEVEMIGNYLSIQQLLYNNKFDFTVTVEEGIDTEAIFLPPMLTQPFIENAIKHGLSGRNQNGMIDIRFYLRESKLFFEVLDNGKGFEAEKPISNHKSLAMTITKERLVNYTKNQDFVVQTDNIKDSNEKVVGAKVVFEIPYIYEN
ncbi:tetratricopeptide repeat-containing sensor histidine kinase [Flavobacterium sp.]